MKVSFQDVKKLLQFIASVVNVISFIVLLILSEIFKNPENIKYTDLSRKITSIYIIATHCLLIIYLLKPRFVEAVFSHNLAIFNKDNFRIFLCGLISIMHWSTDNLFAKLYGMISFCCCLSLFIIEIVFNCEILENNNDKVNGLKNNIKTSENKEVIN